MHHDLLPLPARQRRGAVRAEALRQHRERVGAAMCPFGLRGRIRFRGNVRQRQGLERGVGGTRGSTLLVRVEDVVLRLHGHMARVSAV
jgi:hypothetical protein